MSADYQEQIYISPAFEKIWGRSCETLYNNPGSWLSFLLPEDRERLCDSISERNENPSPQKNYFERYRIVRPDGKIRWIKDQTFPIFDEDNNHIGFVGIAHDFTEEKDRELALTKTKELAEKATQSKLELIANISHELRTPLLSIKSGATALQQCLPTLFESHEIAVQKNLQKSTIRGPRFKELSGCLDRINKEIKEANSAIDMLLMNVNEGKISSCSFENFTLSECLKEALSRYPFSSSKERRKVRISKKNNFTFFGSKILMVHMLFNLIKNSLRFSGNKKNTVINIWFSNHKDTNHLHFKDNGEGVSPEVLPNLFDRFYTTTGTGIGLAFCKQAMNSFNGEIRCETELGEYTEFILQFPKIV